MPDEERPDIRPQLREFLGWYEKVVGRIEAGALVAPGDRNASQKRRQPWLTFSISLIPRRTSPPARRVETCPEDVECQNSVPPGKRLIRV
jgi:hypothetical protein